MAKIECTICGQVSYRLERHLKAAGVCSDCFKERKLAAKAKAYGIALWQLIQLRAEASGRCMICGAEERRAKTIFHIDHDHETGLVRGILCPACNSGLARFDNRRWRERALAYLIRAQQRRWDPHPLQRRPFIDELYAEVVADEAAMAAEVAS